MVRSLSLLGLLAALAACSDAPTSPEPEGTPPRPTNREPTQAPPDEREGGYVPVRGPSDLSLLEAPARALAGEGTVEAIAANYPLRVVSVRVQPGDRVDTGAVLVEVSSPLVLAAAASHRSASESLALVEARLRDVRALHDERSATAEQVFALEREAMALRTIVREANATLRGAGVAPAEAATAFARGSIALRARHAGTVRELSAVVGAVHPEGHVFGAIVTGSSRRIEARFPRLPNEGFRYEFEDLRGQVFDLGSTPSDSLDAGEHGGILVWFDLPSSIQIPPDALGHVHAVPTSAEFVEVPVSSLRPTAEGAEVSRRRGTDVQTIRVRVVTSSTTSAIVVGDLRTTDEVSVDPPAGDEP